MKLKFLLLFLLAQVAWAQSPTPSASPTLERSSPSFVSETDLLGTWLHVSTSDTVGGKQKEVAPVEIKWTFQAGGRGTFSQKISVSGEPWLSSLTWSLNGDTIELAGGRTRYTVVRSGSDVMIWKNQEVGNYYHVRRIL